MCDCLHRLAAAKKEYLLSFSPVFIDRNRLIRWVTAVSGPIRIPFPGMLFDFDHSATCFGFAPEAPAVRFQVLFSDLAEAQLLSRYEPDQLRRFITRVLVDRKQCNQERIKTLWANHRRNVYHQAELDFMEEFAVVD